MSILQSEQDTKRKICGECKHRKKLKFRCAEEWECCNPDSEFCGVMTGYSDFCEDWEGKE